MSCRERNRLLGEGFGFLVGEVGFQGREVHGWFGDVQKDLEGSTDEQHRQNPVLFRRGGAGDW